MSLIYQKNGNLIPGIHETTWAEFMLEFGYNKHRDKLIEGLARVISDLKEAGVTILYVDGSFVSKKPEPADFDACWDPTGVNFKKLSSLHPVLMDFMSDRAKQKAKYGGELFPSPQFLAFFQRDREGQPKGIIKLNF
ncbi:MAG: hypothetical protein KGM98_07955 [Bacteroidota bacterium]|nr:hypothetical protein [Bacteroidota bacterium]